ncbi:IclR family transcriptional regulator [Planococcus maritimus]|nr:IclR family transcriptional regulator [Planococcus sp. SK3692]MDE4084506.1 IclR family transcriptional regulator [Planococcus maritimus]
MTANNENKSSVEKALHLLDSFSDRKFFLSLEEIADHSDIPKTTTFRLLASLESYGYIRKTITAGKTYYSLGYGFLTKGNMVAKHIDIREVARDEMRELRDQSGLTVQLAIRDGAHALYVEQFESWSPIRVFPSIGRRIPLHAAACPRVLLAYLSETEQQSLIKQLNFQGDALKNLCNEETLIEHLYEIRSKGFSISRGELIPGTIALAVPIINPATEDVIASLSLIALESHFSDNIEDYLPMLKKSSQQISAKLIS